MPDLLSPTNPVPKYESTAPRSAPIPPNGGNVQNIVDPQRVVRPDNRAEQQDAGDAARKMRYESNFLTFVQRLREAPDLSESFFRLLQDRSLQVSSGISDGLAAELNQFLKFLRMDEARLSAFLLNQLSTSTRFGGPLFQALRTAFANAQSDVLRTDILQFLRQYSDYSSTAQLEGNISRMLFEMCKSLPSRWSNQLMSLGAQFENGVAAGDRQGNLKLLREQVFPLIADYVQKTHDHGRARSLLSLLTLDVIRYENGDLNQLLQSFRHLNSFHAFPGDFSHLSDTSILKLLQDTDFLKASNNDQFAERLSSLAARAMNGEGGINAQEAFRNILSSVLLNESVYMPLRHLMLPFQWNGQSVYSELWIDPDSEEKRRERGEKEWRILIKMDIQELGAFDLLISAQGNDTCLQVACPPRIAEFSTEISRQLSGILKRNGLNVSAVNVAAMKRPLTISEVFPKIFEKGGNGVDVKV